MRLNLSGFMLSRTIVEPQRKLTPQEMKIRMSDYFDCSLLELLTKRSPGAALRSEFRINDHRGIFSNVSQTQYAALCHH